MVGPELDQLLPCFCSGSWNWLLFRGWGQGSVVAHDLTVVHSYIFQSEVFVSTFSQVTSIILFKDQATFLFTAVNYSLFRGKAQVHEIDTT